MAKRVKVSLVDDLDGSQASETVRFAVRGTTYEIDLSAKNAAAFDSALARFISAGRKVGRGSANGRARTVTATRVDVDLAAVRAWAASNNIKVSPRGRVAASVIDAFRAAGN
ncbi:MAG: Lsr2 family protein [Actinomycetota bacterium]|nr:MAG: Lsr2 family protein [Actinomycetota bacterium]